MSEVAAPRRPLGVGGRSHSPPRPTPLRTPGRPTAPRRGPWRGSFPAAQAAGFHPHLQAPVALTQLLSLVRTETNGHATVPTRRKVKSGSC